MRLSVKFLILKSMACMHSQPTWPFLRNFFRTAQSCLQTQWSSGLLSAGDEEHKLAGNTTAFAMLRGLLHLIQWAGNQLHMAAEYCNSCLILMRSRTSHDQLIVTLQAFAVPQPSHRLLSASDSQHRYRLPKVALEVGPWKRRLCHMLSYGWYFVELVSPSILRPL